MQNVKELGRLYKKIVKNKATILNKKKAANMKHKTSSSNHFNCREAYTEHNVTLRNLSKGTILLHLSTNIPSEDRKTLNYQENKVYFYAY